MATEARAERRHPPPAARRAIAQRLRQDEEHERTGEIAETAEDVGAAARGIFAQAGEGAQPLEHRAPTGVPDPRTDVGLPELALLQLGGEQRGSVLSRRLRHGAREDVAQ